MAWLLWVSWLTGLETGRWLDHSVGLAWTGHGPHHSTRSVRVGRATLEDWRGHALSGLDARHAVLRAHYVSGGIGRLLEGKAVQGWRQDMRYAIDAACLDCLPGPWFCSAPVRWAGCCWQGGPGRLRAGAADVLAVGMGIKGTDRNPANGCVIAIRHGSGTSSVQGSMTLWEG